MNSIAAEIYANKRNQVDAELEKTEQMVYDLETQYLQMEGSQYGTVLRGFEGFLSSKDAQRKRQRGVFKPEDRLFSLSSKQSPATAEVEAALAEAAEAQAALHGGRGKAYATKGLAVKARR